MQDDVDATNGSPTSLFTPALTRRLTPMLRHLHVQWAAACPRQPRTSAAVESELGRLLPSALPHDFTADRPTEGKAERAFKPESIALGVFGGIAALAAAADRRPADRSPAAAGRRRSRGRCGRSGADPAMTMGDGLLGILLAVVAGSLLAVARRRGALPAGPPRPGPRRRIPTPGRGVRLDRARRSVRRFSSSAWSPSPSRLAVREAPRRSVANGRPSRARTSSSVAAAAAAAGLPPPAVTGDPLRARARRGPQRRARSLGDPRCGAAPWSS